MAVTPEAGTTHHITIKVGTTEYGFMLAPNARAGITNPSSQQINQAIAPVRLDADPGQARGLNTAWTVDSMHHGIDRFQFESGDLRAYSTDAGVDISNEGYITLAAQWASSDASGGTATGPMIIDFQDRAGTFNYIVMCSGTNLRVYDDSDGLWHTAQPSAGAFSANAIFLFVHNDTLFVALDGAEFWTWDGDSGTSYGDGWGQPSTTPGDYFPRGFFRYRDELHGWGATAGGAGASDEIASMTDDGATMAKITEGDIGDPATDIIHAWVQEDVILAGKPDGLHYHDLTDERNLYPDVAKSTINFRMGAMHEGFGYTNILDTIRKVTVVSGANFTDITPQMKGSAEKELYGHGQPFWAFNGARSLFVAFDKGQGTASGFDFGELLKYNGVGWHQVAVTAADTGMEAAGYSRMKGWLLYNAGGVTKRKRTIDLGESEFPDYVTSGEVVSPRYDGGYPDERKSFRKIIVETEDCSSTKTVAVYTKLDTGSWNLEETIVDNGKHEVIIGQIDAHRVGFNIQYKLVLASDSTSATPRVRMPVTMIMFVRNKLQMGHNFTLILGATTLLDGSVETVTVLEQRLFLRSIINTTQNVIITNYWGELFRAIGMNISIEWAVDEPKKNEEHAVNLRLADAYTELWPQVVNALQLAIVPSSTLVTTPSWEYDSTWNYAWTYD